MSSEGNEKSKGLFLTDDMIRSSGIVTKKDLAFEIETQVTKRIVKIAIWIITALVFTIFGYIIGNLWILNGEIRELKGKISSPENIIQHISSRIELLESKNQSLVDSLQKLQFINLQNEINFQKKLK